MFLQFHLVLALAVGRTPGVGHSDVLIRLRIVHIVVDAVDNACQFMAAAAQQTVHLFAVMRCLNLFGIGAAHCCQPVGIRQAALQIVHGAEELQLVVGEILRSQAQQLAQYGGREDTLVLQVMDGKDGAHGRIQVTVMGGQQHGYRRRMPVMAVQHIGYEADIGQHLEDGAAVKGESLAVVIVTVQAPALKVIFVVDKVIGHALVLELFHATVLTAPAYRRILDANGLHHIPEMGGNLTVLRQNYAGIDTCFDQFLRQ